MSANEKKPGFKSPLENYRRTDVMTANRETILLMMYSGAIRFLKQAIDLDKSADPAERTRLLGKVQEILTELRSTLNFEVGGDIANHLDALYCYMGQRLSQYAMENKVEYLQEVHGILVTLNSAWEQAVEAVKKERNKTTTLGK